MSDNSTFGATGEFLDVRDLRVEFPTEDGLVRAVDGVSFTVQRGRTLAIVGESGSGKSVTAQALMGLHNRKSANISGQVLLGGTDLIAATDEEVRGLRGQEMAMIFQDPLSSLHPFYTVGKQLVEAVRVHQSVSKAAARDQAIAMLDRVGIPNPERRVDDYPHQLSGGMRQRVMIAMALLNGPSLLIADEPTTALDVTVQAQILQLLKDLQAEFNTAIIIITHDLGVVADVADEVVVPYTLGLLASMPRLDRGRTSRLDPIPGLPPSLIRLPTGCVFRPRCTVHYRVPNGRCDTDRPDLVTSGPGHEVRCHLPSDERRAIAVERLGIKIEETA